LTYLVDANVLYSRVLRDYLLYSMRAKLIHVMWSKAILGEVTRRLMEKLPGFTQESADRLVRAMNTAFPYAQRDAENKDFAKLADVVLPDEDDRHVIAAAIAALVDSVCTHDVGDFPIDVMQRFGMTVVTPDDLLCDLIRRHEAHAVGAPNVCGELARIYRRVDNACAQ